MNIHYCCLHKVTNWWKLEMKLETCSQMLIKVNKYADSEYEIFSGFLEASSAEHERTKVAKRIL